MDNTLQLLEIKVQLKQSHELLQKIQEEINEMHKQIEQIKRSI